MSWRLGALLPGLPEVETFHAVMQAISRAGRQAQCGTSYVYRLQRSSDRPQTGRPLPPGSPAPPMRRSANLALSMVQLAALGWTAGVRCEALPTLQPTSAGVSLVEGDPGQCLLPLVQLLDW